MRTNHLLSNPSRRGAARISAAWMIVVIVLLFAVLGYAYIAQDDASTAQRAASDAQREAASADARVLSARQDLSTRSGILGFTTDASVTPSNVDAAQAALDDLKSTLPDMEAVKTFQDAIPVVKSAYAAQATEIGTLQQRIAQLQGDLDAARKAKEDGESALNSTIASLRQELSDQQENLQGEVDRLTEANGELRTQVNATGDRITELQDEVRTEQRSLREKENELTSLVTQHVARLNDIRKRSETPDGEISAVSPSSNYAMINLAASDRLSEGVTFDVIGGLDKSRAKAKARVVDVGPVRSRVEIFNVVDPLGQPVVQGDKIYNPLFEAKGQRYAVLAGNISGAYNEPELRSLFEEIGITIQDEVSNLTDYLVTGGPTYVDEDGAQLEEPLKPEDLPAYGEARDRGVLVIPMRDVMQYFER